MSLIMEVLEKFKGERKGKSVHPLILKKSGKGDNRKIILLLGVLFIASSLLAYALTDYIINSRATAGNFENELRAIKEKVMEKREEKPAPENTGMSVAVKKEEEEPVPQNTEYDKIEQKEILQAKLSSSNPKEEMKKLIQDLKSTERETEPPPQEKKPPQQEIKRAFGRESQDTTAMLLEADRYFKEGNLRKSLEYYEGAYRLSPSKKVANNLLVLYVKLGEKEKAREIINTYRDERLIYTYLVEVARSESPVEALEESERFLAQDNKGYVYFARGFINELIGDYEGALKNYRIAYQKDPANPYFSFNYARMLEATGDLLKASEIYQKLKDMNLEPNMKDIVRERLSYYRRLGVLK